MVIRFLDSSQLQHIQDGINSDQEFRLAARFMSKDMLIEVGESQCIFSISNGILTAINLNPTFMDTWSFAIRAPTESWEKFLQPIPPPFYNGLFSGIHRGTFVLEGDLETAFAHFWAVNRMLDVMRQLQNA